MEGNSNNQLLKKIEELEIKLQESEQLIEAIKAGEVDAFAIGGSESEIYTLQSGDFAYRILIEEIQEGAINVTEEGMIVYSNPYFHKWLSIPYEELIGNMIFEFVDVDSIPEFNKIFNRGLHGKSKGEINLKVKGKLIPVYVSLTSLQPTLATIGIIISDLTQKKKHEQTVLQYHADLENKNRQLTQTNAELASFAYVASHDLQEPLRKIETFAKRIVQEELQNLSENGKDYFKRMHMAAHRMRTLIDDLLTFSRTNTSTKNFETTDLNLIIDEVKESLTEELATTNASFEILINTQASIIPFQFRQLLHNLISNSLKFAKPDTPPHIKIHTQLVRGKNILSDKLNEDLNYCHIHIKDNGIGFEQKYNEKIFELFQRLHPKSEYKGTGIGLAIVKKIVENHKGYIKASSKLDEGATFDIYIPAQ